MMMVLVKKIFERFISTVEALLFVGCFILICALPGMLFAFITGADAYEYGVISFFATACIIQICRYVAKFYRLCKESKGV